MSDILIVEDEPIISLFLCTNLDHHNFTSHHVLSTESDAIHYLDSHAPSLILLDVQLKDDGNGLNVAQFASKAHPNIPIIFMTAYSDETLLNKISEMGHCYILKPFEFKQLYSKMRDVMGQVAVKRP